MRTLKVTASIKATLVALALALAPTVQAEKPILSELNLADHAGKVVILDFWASWCGPCRRSFPWLNAMHRKYGPDGLVIIGVNLDASQDDAMGFLDEVPADFHIYFDTDALLANEYGVEAMPSSIIIGRDGEIQASHRGFKVKKEAEYEAILVAALGEER